MKNEIIRDILNFTLEGFECEIRELVYAGFLSDSAIQDQMDSDRKAFHAEWVISDQVDLLRENHEITADFVEVVKQILSDEKTTNYLNISLKEGIKTTIKKVSDEHYNDQLSWPEVTGYVRLQAAFLELEKSSIITPRDGDTWSDHYDQEIQAADLKGDKLRGCLKYAKLSFEQWCYLESDVDERIRIGLYCYPVSNNPVNSDVWLDEAKKLHVYVNSVLNLHGLETDEVEFDKESFTLSNVVIYPKMVWRKRRYR